MTVPYYGFEHVDLCINHGDLTYGDYDRWLRTKHANPDSLRGAPNDEREFVNAEAWRTRVPEELYDVVKDPDCLHNLIDSPQYQAELKQLRATLDAELVKSKDPMLEAFRKREDREFVETYVQQLEKEAGERKRNKPPRNKPNKNKPKKRTP